MATKDVHELSSLWRQKLAAMMTDWTKLCRFATEPAWLFELAMSGKDRSKKNVLQLSVLGRAKSKGEIATDLALEPSGQGLIFGDALIDRAAGPV